MKKKIFFITTISFVLTTVFITGASYKYKKIAKIYQIKPASKEIIIAAPMIGAKLNIGAKLFVKVNGKYTPIIVTFPMMTIAKCRFLKMKSSALSKLKKNMPVFTRRKLKEVKPKTPAFKREKREKAEKLIVEEKSEKVIPEDVKFFAKRFFIGKWKEYWDPDGNSDVTYNDKYRVYDNYGNISVKPIGKGQKITKVTLKDGILSFSLFTSFEVKYSMQIHEKGKWLYGSAITPKKSYFIKWERIGD